MLNWNIELSKEGEEKFWDSKGRGRIERGECVMERGKEEGKNIKRVGELTDFHFPLWLFSWRGEGGEREKERDMRGKEAK